MKKTYKFTTKHSVELDSSAGWIFLYREQFGKDILPDLLAYIGAIAEAVADIGEKDISEVVDNAVVSLSAGELTSLLSVVWAMAKNADDTIPGPVEFWKQFDRIAWDEIGPGIFWQLLESNLSKKKIQAMKEIRLQLAGD